MAIINIKYSQSVVDHEHLSALNTPVLNGSIGLMVDTLAINDYNIRKYYPSIGSGTFDGSTLRINFPDGATETYTGVVLENPLATQGGATANGFEFYKDGVVTVNEGGTLNYDYVLTPLGTGYSLVLGASAKGSTATALRLATHLPTSSPSYDPTYGNVTLSLNGALKTLPSGDVSGSISKIIATADKFLLSGVIDGNFHVTGNIDSVGQALTHSVVDGVLTSYKEDYRDGSHAYVTDVSTYLSAAQQLDDTILADASRFAGNDDITLDLPANLYVDILMASGDGNDRISIKGGGGRLNVSAGSGNDQISILGDKHLVDGGSGIDTVSLTGTRANYSVLKTAAGYSLTDSAGAVSTLVNVERISFSDTTLALDISGNGGQAYRLYQAAFNRTPDSAGLGYWISVLDKGSSLGSIANGFVNSTEFKTAYGTAPSNHDLVTQFYQNILHRAPEAAGLAYWTGILDSKAAGVPEVLASISESNENQVGLIGVIGNGFTFTPFG